MKSETEDIQIPKKHTDFSSVYAGVDLHIGVSDPYSKILMDLSYYLKNMISEY